MATLVNSVSVRLEPEYFEKLSQIAKETGTTISCVIRKIVSSKYEYERIRTCFNSLLGKFHNTSLLPNQNLQDSLNKLDSLINNYSNSFQLAIKNQGLVEKMGSDIESILSDLESEIVYMKTELPK